MGGWGGEGRKWAGGRRGTEEVCEEGERRGRELGVVGCCT